MKAIRLLPVAVICCLLAGCESEIVLPITTSLANGSAVTKTGTMVVEVPECIDSSTGLESAAILQAKQQVGFALKDAKLGKCSKRGYSYAAQFLFPVVVGHREGKLDPDRIGVELIDGQAVISVGENIRNRFQKLSNSTSGVDSSSMKIRLLYKNDSGSDQTVKVVSSFVKPYKAKQKYIETPAHDATITQQKGQAMIYTLSDVGSYFLMSKGVAKVFDVDK